MLSRRTLGTLGIAVDSDWGFFDPPDKQAWNELDGLLVVWAGQVPSSHGMTKDKEL